MVYSDFKNLVAWQKAMDLVSDVYNVVNCFPNEELYGLTSQIKRSVISIPSNIAEGQARGSKKEFIHFLHYARGSAAELETQLLISVKVGIVTLAQIESLIKDLQHVGYITLQLIKSLEKKNPNN